MAPPSEEDLKTWSTQMTVRCYSGNCSNIFSTQGNQTFTKWTRWPDTDVTLTEHDGGRNTSAKNLYSKQVCSLNQNSKQLPRNSNGKGCRETAFLLQWHIQLLIRVSHSNKIVKATGMREPNRENWQQFCRRLLGAVHRTWNNENIRSCSGARARAHGTGSVEAVLDPALNFQNSTQKKYGALRLRWETALDRQRKRQPGGI